MLMLCIISRPSKTSHGPHLARGPHVFRLCSIRISVYIILCYRGPLWYLCTFCVIHTFTKYPLLNFPKFSHMLVRSIKHKYIAFHWNSLFFSIIWHIMKIWSENRHSGLKPHWISLSRPTSLDLFTQVLFWVPRGSLRLVMIYLWSCLIFLGSLLVDRYGDGMPLSSPLTFSLSSALCKYMQITLCSHVMVSSRVLCDISFVMLHIPKLCFSCICLIAAFTSLSFPPAVRCLPVTFPSPCNGVITARSKQELGRYI